MDESHNQLGDKTIKKYAVGGLVCFDFGKTLWPWLDVALNNKNDLEIWVVTGRIFITCYLLKFSEYKFCDNTFNTHSGLFRPTHSAVFPLTKVRFWKGSVQYRKSEENMNTPKEKKQG